MVLVGIGVAVATTLKGSGAGTSSPESAVRDLATAGAQRDLAGALRVTDPAEVGPLGKVFNGVIAKGGQNGLLDSAHPLNGFTFTSSNLAYSTAKLSPDVAKVTLTSGSITVGFDPKLARAAARLDSSGVARGPDTVTLNVADHASGSARGVYVMVVRRSGRWYVSPAYTAAEYLVDNQRLPHGDFALASQAGRSSGVADPKELLTTAASRVANGQFTTALDLLPPDEFGPVFDYRAAISQELNSSAGIATFGQQNHLSVDSSNVTVQSAGGGLDKIILNSASGTLTSQSGTWRWNLDGMCLQWVSADSGHRSAGCLTDRGLPPAYGSLVQVLSASVHQPYVMASRHNGRWFLDPIATLAAYAHNTLPTLNEHVLLRLAGTPQLAHPIGSAEVNRPVSGTLSGSDAYQVYTVKTHPGSHVVACASPSNDSPDVRLFRDGEQDLSPLPDGYADAVVLNGPTDGRIRLLVRSASTSSIGAQPASSSPTAFRVMVAEVPVQNLPPNGDIAVDGTAPCGQYLYQFQGEAGQYISTSSDSAVAVYAADKTPLNSNGFGVTLPSTQMYYVLVTTRSAGWTPEATQVHVGAAATPAH